MRETVLELLYDEALDAGSVPAVTAYTLTADSAQSHLVSVDVADRTVTLTFASAPAEGATVTLAYAAPALNPVKDAAGNPAPAFTGLTVVRGPVVMSIDLGRRTDDDTRRAALRLHQGAALEQCPRAEGVQGPRDEGLRRGRNAHVQGPVRPAGDGDGCAHPQARSVGRDTQRAVCERLGHGHAHLHLGAGVDRRQRLRRDRGESARPRRGEHRRRGQRGKHVRRRIVRGRALPPTQDLRRLPRDADRWSNPKPKPSKASASRSASGGASGKAAIPRATMCCWGSPTARSPGSRRAGATRRPRTDRAAGR